MTYQKNDSFVTPSDDTVIYRYLSFTKFAALLDKQSIYFSPASDFEDKYEGAIGNKVAPNLYSLWARRMKQFILISSWHRSNHESLAMYKIYMESTEGVAIKTTIGKLKENLKTHFPVYIGEISYVDYDNFIVPNDNLFLPYLFKQESFSYEKEIRAILNLMPQQDGNFTLKDDDDFFVQTNLNNMIDEVVVSPFAQDWFLPLVSSISKKYGLKVPVKESAIKINW